MKRTVKIKKIYIYNLDKNRFVIFFYVKLYIKIN